ncbi:MAG TPA: RNA methyltransferase [Methanomicrobiales archaeon]|nr:RNA methyltransferase [Methanomicrobiales archaeon]
MPEISIVLVEPLHEGNVGFSARAMKNFGFSDLVLVDPCPLGDLAKACAMHASDVLDHARTMTLEEVFSTYPLIIATTGGLTKSVCRSMRMPYYTPKELRDQIAGVKGKVAILFGRENRGLSNEEVRRCDLICTIPASPEYPILNISHAVGILCYELAGIPRGTYRLAEREEMECLYEHLDHFLDKIEHPGFKRKNTLLMARRILGRTLLTTREVSTIHGILRRAEWHVNGEPWESPGKGISKKKNIEE